MAKLLSKRAIRAYRSPGTLSPKERADVKYRVRRHYKEVIEDLKLIMGNSGVKERKFYVDLFVNIPEISEMVSIKPVTSNVSSRDGDHKYGQYDESPSVL